MEAMEGSVMSAHRKMNLIFSFTLVLALVLAACGGGGEAPAEATEPAGGGAPQEAAEPTAVPAAERKVAVFIFTQEFDTLNPYYTNMWFSEITHQLWNHWAWEFDDNNNPVPVLLTEMPTIENGGVSEDGMVITMRLRPELTWSDGEPITADDFVFTYDMIVDPNNTVATTYPYDSEVESVVALDDHTVQVNFYAPFIPWVANLWHGLLPEHILKPVYDAEGSIDGADWNLSPTVGSGPFVFSEWESGSFARFVRNDEYWGEPAKLDEIFVRFVPDDAAQINALVAGDGDLGTFFSYSDLAELESAGVEIYKVVSGFDEGLFFFLGEPGHPALKDKRVRQAIAYATDRDSLVQDLLLGLTTPAVTFWDMTPPFADTTLKPYPYDPDMARSLLDEAGWIDSNGDGTRDKDGVELVLTYGTTDRDIRIDTQAVIQQELVDVGIGVDLYTYDYDQFFGGYGDGGPVATGELDIAEYSDAPQFPDADIYYWLCDEIPTDAYPDGGNWQWLCDEQLDALFKQQINEPDADARLQIMYQIEQIMYDEMYWLGLWRDPDLFGVNGRVTNVKISGRTPFFNVAEWDLTP
jgi:peptide/nickel transport system substrate-binding protein